MRLKRKNWGEAAPKEEPFSKEKMKAEAEEAGKKHVIPDIWKEWVRKAEELAAGEEDTGKIKGGKRKKQRTHRRKQKKQRKSRKQRKQQKSRKQRKQRHRRSRNTRRRR